MTLADALCPRWKGSHAAVIRDATLVSGGSILVALCSQIAVPLPFSPVPVTGQTLAVLLVGVLLGGRRGALSLALYVAEGAIGLPVFAGGGAGLARLLGPTGGYLMGFVVGAWLVGSLAERGWDRRVHTTALAMLLGTVAIYVVGLSRLAWFVGIGRVLYLGLYPFVLGDVLKMVLAMLTVPAGWELLRRIEGA